MHLCYACMYMASCVTTSAHGPFKDFNIDDKLNYSTLTLASVEPQCTTLLLLGKVLEPPLLYPVQLRESWMDQQYLMYVRHISCTHRIIYI